VRAVVRKEVGIASGFTATSSRTEVLGDVLWDNLLVCLSDCMYVCGCLSLNRKHQVIFGLQLHCFCVGVLV